MKKVCIIERVVCDYHKEFYLLLHSKLQSENVSLTVCAGHPWPNEGLVDILDGLDFGVRCRNIRLVGKSYWESGSLKAAAGADLVIFEQANSALINYYLLLRRKLGGKTKTAFWGHGALFKNNYPVRSLWKKFFANKTDWWFAYTELSAGNIEKSGFPKSRITVVNNAIDTVSIRNEREKLTSVELDALRQELFPGDRLARTEYLVGVYCGRLTENKRVPFLLESLQLIHEKIPEFRMIIVGDGIDSDKVALFCKKNNWVAWVGAKQGLDRVKYLALGDAWLNPGALGLAILDSFSLGIPLLTTDIPTHGPEIVYLRHGVNGLIANHDMRSYADTVVDLFKNREYLAKLQKGSRDSSRLYSCEAMAEKFRDGVMRCLAT